MLTRRKGIYYYRKAIPQHLRALIGRREFIISLKTRDSRLALQRGHNLDVYCSDLIAKAEAGEPIVADKKVFGDLLHAVSKTTVLENIDGSKVTTSVTEFSPDDIQALVDAGMSPEQIERVVSLFAGQSTKSQVGTIQTPEAIQDSPKLGAFVSKFISDWERLHETEMDSRKKTQLRRLVEILSAGKPITEIKRDDAIEVRNTLAKLPAHTTKYAGKPIQEIISLAEAGDPEYAKVQAKTIEHYFETYKSLFRSAQSAGILTGEHPFKDIPIVTGGKHAERQERLRRLNVSKTPYDKDDLTRIFSTSLHIQFGLLPEHENVKYWLPLIGLFTGSRMSQIASLYCSDITVKDGIDVIDFNDATPDKSGKTDVSFRQVPIHPLLIRLGIRQFAKKVASYGHERLFPELRSFNNDSYAGRIDEWFNRKFLMSLGVRKPRDNKSFHAFRSTLLGLLKAAKVEEHTRNNIIGWMVNDDKANTIVRTHYDKVTLEHMLVALKAIELPPVFDSIRPVIWSHQNMNFARRYVNQHNKK